jgi:nucleoside-diphosphate-sugar epimerase
MRILVTGSEGYLGCLLGPELIRDGHEVVGVDTGFYRNGWLYRGVDRTVYTLDQDVRRLTVETCGTSTRSCTWASCRTTRSAT